MIAIIRIKGMVKVPRDIEETLNRLRLRRKYTCTIVREKPEVKGMLNKVRNFVAYGKIDKELFVELVEKRGKLLGKKGKMERKDAEKIAEEFFEGRTEIKLEKLGIKPFFRLHPPRQGIKSKLRYPKGVLGNHKQEIGKLIRRMF